MPNRVGRTARRDPEATREQLLAAGVRVLMRDPSHGAAGLRAADVAQEAGRTTGAFFHHWKSQDHYLDELVEHIYSIGPDAQGAIAAAGLRELEATGRVADAIRAAIVAAPETVFADARVIANRRFALRALNDLEFRERVARLTDHIDDVQAETFWALTLAILQREPRPPFTSADLNLMFANIVDTFAIEMKIRPHRFIDGYLVAILVPLLETFSRPLEDTRDLDAKVSESLAILCPQGASHDGG